MAKRKQKTMQLRGFKQAVKKLAKGDYHCAQLRITEYKDEEIKHTWSAYIGRANWTGGYSTPEAALTELEGLLRVSR